MNEAQSRSDRTGQDGRRLFVSYATKDRKQAMAVCQAIERRGFASWIATRDVAPGENYQEAIVAAIRNAAALVLIFSDAANESNEIKKELSLASRYRIPVIAFRIKDVEPGDAFAYELSTRQWIDAFKGWDRSIDTLVARIEQLSGLEPATTAAVPPAAKRTMRSNPGRSAIAIGLGVLLLLAAAGWMFWLRPQAKTPHSMTVRLTGFQRLSADVPATISDAIAAEISAAFHADGVIGVSTAAIPPAGKAPAYTLGGTIQRVGDTVRVITRLTNERSGESLWSDSFDYDGQEVAKIPRHIAVDTGNIVRCGLFGASTYRKALPDPVLRDYMQFCQGHWNISSRDGRKALVPAQRVVAALPDFSWGWAAVAGGYWKVAGTAENERLDSEARKSGRDAADRAVALDGRNSEALYIKAVLLDRDDWLGREQLFKRAIAARRLDCGCEHHQYGWMLANVGRVTEAVASLRQANDMLALYVYTTLSLADALIAAGRPEEAKESFDAAIDLAPEPAFAKRLAMYKATATRDVSALRDPGLPLSDDLRSALIAGYQSTSQDVGAKAQAVRRLVALPDDQQNQSVALLLADLGADHEAFLVAARLSTKKYPGPSLFWYRGMEGTLRDPGFPALATKIGLMRYWKESRTRPDVCNQAAPPPFCGMI